MTVHYIGDDHPMHYVSMSPHFYGNGSEKDKKQPNALKLGDMTIVNDVWISQGVIILSGCHRIGNGAVIGAGAIVTKDIPDCAICVGSPAKIIKYRFDEDTIQRLICTKWWKKTQGSV